VESRAGQDGIRQFLFALRKSADTSVDPFQTALQMDRDTFDRAFDAYLRQRFTTAANQPPRARGAWDATRLRHQPHPAAARLITAAEATR